VRADRCEAARPLKPGVGTAPGGLQISVALPDGSAVVILQTVALAFHPQVAPPATQLLDSTGLTTLLLMIAAAIGLLMLFAYWRAGRTGLGKLA